MVMQSLGYVRALRQFEDPAVVNNARTHVTAAQWNNPAPPAMTHQMIRSPRTRRSARVHVSGIFFPPVITVPILDPGKPRPNRVDRMIEIGPVPTKLAGKKRGSATGVDQPPRGDSTFAPIYRYTECLATAVAKIALRYLGRPPQIASGFNRTFEEVRIQLRPIHLEGLNPS